MAHRIVHRADVTSPGLIEDFRSNAARGAAPRVFELQYPALHEGISMYEDPEAARQTARAFPKLGDFVARVELLSGRGITFARWGAKTHMTVWGEPEILAALIMDVQPVRQ